MVNKDELKNSEESAVNFDIHIGKNANINIYIEKGHLNVLLDEGDSNIQLKKGDVNIRQDCGHYNHFVNGDYNVECTGHMHVVVGEDQLTEIGGNRDVRVDGNFDYLNMTKSGSVQETLLEGSRRTKIKENLQEHIDKITERDYGNSVVERYRNAAERTYEKSFTSEKHYAWSVGVGSSIGGGSETLAAGDLSIYAGRSAIRTDEDNFLISGAGSAGLAGYANVFIEAGVVENRRNKDAVLRIFSENLSFIGGKKSVNIFSRDELRLSSLQRMKLFSSIEILSNKEITQSDVLS